MSEPIKKAGFKQGIYQQSSSALEQVGTLRILKDGTMFRYAKAASALTMGKVCIAKAGVSDLVDNAQTGYGASSGAYTMTVVVSSLTTALVENELKGGYLTVNDETHEGNRYEIAGSAAAASGATTVQVTLKDPLIEAISATDEVSLAHSLWYGVSHSSTEENSPAGVPLIDVTSGYYCWLMTHGVANVLNSGTPTLGAMVTLSDTAGAVEVFDATTILTFPLVGRVIYQAGVDTEYRPIFLLID